MPVCCFVLFTFKTSSATAGEDYRQALNLLPQDAFVRRVNFLSAKVKG